MLVVRHDRCSHRDPGTREPDRLAYECAAFGLVLVMSASEYAIPRTRGPDRSAGSSLRLLAEPGRHPDSDVAHPDRARALPRRPPPVSALASDPVVADRRCGGGIVRVGVPRRVFQVGDSAYVRNPFSIGSGGADRLWLLLVSLLLVGIVGSLSSVVIRYRRSEAEQRQQLRWLAAAVLVIGVAGVVAFAIGFLPETDVNAILRTIAVYVMLVAATIGLPAATAVAILRFRLYDLDLVVKKTVVFTIVAVFILLLYIAALALAAISTVGAIAGALILVVTFNTVRRRARKVADRIVYGKRATPFEVMSDFSERMGETYSIDDVLPRMTELLTGSTGASEARVWLRSGSRLQPVAASPPDAPTVADAVLGDGEQLPSFEDDISSYPVTHQGDLLGALTLRMPANDPMDPSKERLVHGLASQAGLVLRNVAPRAGPAGVAQAPGCGTGRGTPPSGAQHPRRGPAAARRTVREDPAGRATHGARTCQGARGIEWPAVGHDGRARGPAGPGSRDLPAALGRQGPARCALRASSQVGHSDHGGAGRDRQGTPPRSRRPSTSAAWKPCRTSRNTRRPHAPRSGSLNSMGCSFSRSRTTGSGSTWKAPCTEVACRAWQIAWTRSAARSRSEVSRERAPR